MVATTSSQLLILNSTYSHVFFPFLYGIIGKHYYTKYMTYSSSFPCFTIHTTHTFLFYLISIIYHIQYNIYNIQYTSIIYYTIIDIIYYTLHHYSIGCICHIYCIIII